MIDQIMMKMAIVWLNETITINGSSKRIKAKD